MAHLVPVILIVEDEYLLRMDAADMIEQAGFEVVQAGNPTRPSRSSRPVPISTSSSPMSRCRVRWMG